MTAHHRKTSDTHHAELVHFLEPDGVPTLDVDGIASILFNVTSVTLEFYKAVPDRKDHGRPSEHHDIERPDINEQRMVVGRLTMPAPAFYEMVANVTLQVRTDRASIDRRNLLYQDQMKRVLDLIEETR
jgi:hypothetical protein